ncbi:DUF6434 domain-containing protein [Streptomyces xanthophaeus]|uniref:DUF6434 domain-containing protein n=1 Tax=Streptomyces xanthophaeus TaxID=67385 RepID=UPI00398FD6B6
MRTNEGGPDASRPALTPALTGTELTRWYWTLAELTALARQLGLSTSGGKAALTDRLAAVLDGRPEPRPVRTARRGGRQLAAPVHGDTVIPEGQRCSQVLREYFTREIGPAFHFDAFMRDYVAQGAGRTLAEAVSHWHATRQRAAEHQEVGAQFEFNRFLRDWHARHPDGARTEALAAWRDHRARPKDRRAAGHSTRRPS